MFGASFPVGWAAGFVAAYEAADGVRGAAGEFLVRCSSGRLTGGGAVSADRGIDSPAPSVPEGVDASDGVTVPVSPSASAGAREGEGVPLHAGRSRHAGPRLPRRTRFAVLLRRAWSTVARFAGPLYLAGVCGAIGAVLVAAHVMGKG